MMFMLTVFILTRGHRNKRLNVGMLLASSTLTLLSSAVRYISSEMLFMFH